MQSIENQWVPLTKFHEKKSKPRKYVTVYFTWPMLKTHTTYSCIMSRPPPPLKKRIFSKMSSKELLYIIWKITKSSQNGKQRFPYRCSSESSRWCKVMAPIFVTCIWPVWPCLPEGKVIIDSLYLTLHQLTDQLPKKHKI